MSMFFYGVLSNQYKGYACLLYQKVHYFSIINFYLVIITVALLAIQREMSSLKTGKELFGIHLAVCAISRLDKKTK